MSFTARTLNQEIAESSFQTNPSNVKVVCRIRPPKTFDSSRDASKVSQSGNLPTGAKHYTSVRQRSRSNSKDISSPSPFRHYASLRQTSRENSKSHNRSSSRDKSRSSTGKHSFVNLTGNGQVQGEKKYCVFTTKERSNVVVACENPVPGKIINESLVDVQDLKYFNNALLGQNTTFSFNFDTVFNESHKQEKFYSSNIRPVVKSFVEGENACILLFGPTEGGKTYTLKGKTGIERGILPRAVEDIFNIVKNSEERDEDYEMLNNKMMRDDEDEEDLYPESQNFNRTYDNRSTRNNNLMEQAAPERMFLRVSVYQIFVDKVLDLLGQQVSKNQRVQVDHYIDKESEEVVSKLKNITEKVVFTLEDFYSVLQEAFKNRRIESVSLQEQDLRKKSHFIINLTLMKRTQNKKLIEISTLNFVEMSGSEQAVAEEKFYKDTSVRSFVTRSFNGISSQIVRSALKKKQKVQSMDDGDIKVVNCLRNTLTSASNIVLVCCVNPSPQFFEHSLPAIKFCARIRDCILKKLNRDTRNSRKGIDQLSETGDSIRYNLESDRGNKEAGSYDTVKEIIEHLKEDYVNKQMQKQNGRSDPELERWCFDRQETIERLLQRVRQMNLQEKQQLLLTTELNYIKEGIQKIRYQSSLVSPREAFGPSLGDTYNSLRSSAERPNTYQRNEGYDKMASSYNPYQVQSYNYLNSDMKPQSAVNYSNDQPYDYQQSRNHAAQQYSHNQNIFTEDQSQYQKYEGQQQQDELSQYKPAATPQFDQPLTTNQSSSRMMLKPRTTNAQLQESDYKASNHFTTQDKSLEQSAEKTDIKVFNQHSNDSRYISRIQPVNASQSVVTCQENDFLKSHPQVDIALQGKKNSISENNSPEQEKQEQNTTFNRYRPTPKGLATLQKSYNTQQQQEQSTLLNNMSKISNPASVSSVKKTQMKALQTRFNQQMQSAAPKLILKQQEAIEKKKQQIKSEAVYQTQQDAMNDITRLIKFQDFEGLKVRLMQIYKEKEDQEKLVDDEAELVEQLKEQMEQKDQILEEQDKIIQEAQQEFQITIDDLTQQKQDSEKDYQNKSQTLGEQVKDLQQKYNEIKQEKEKLSKASEILEIENKELVKLKEEADKKQKETQDENDKLKANYEILKEHEMSIIKDYEGKKQKEVTFYEAKIIDLHNQSKDDLMKNKELEEEIFKLKEEIKKMEFEAKRGTEDRNQMMENIQKLGDKLETEEEQKNQLQKQVEQMEKEYQKLEELKDKINDERNTAFGEIEKLHALIEEMEKAIQNEQEKKKEEIALRESKESEIKRMNEEKKSQEEEIAQRCQELEAKAQKIQELEKQLALIGKMNEDMEKQLTLIKAKEYDKVDIMKRAAELEARMKYLQVDNENLVKERNNLDIANVNLNKDKQEMEQQIMSLESELEFFRTAHEEHLDKFDQKFEAISIELSKLKNENIQLKEKEKLNKRQIRDIEEERNEYQERAQLAEKKCQEMGSKLNDLERDVRLLLQEKERDIQENAMRMSMEEKMKEENKGKMLGDIHNMIKQYKDEKRLTKSQGLLSSTGAQANSGYSAHSSVYY